VMARTKNSWTSCQNIWENLFSLFYRLLTIFNQRNR
jgi:hypothetical protein